MQYHDRINSIRERAARLKVPLRDVVRAGRVHYSTFCRWGHSDANPQYRKMSRALDAMDRFLDDATKNLAAELIESLQGRAA